MMSDQKKALVHIPASALFLYLVLPLFLLSPPLLARTLIFQADEAPAGVEQSSKSSSVDKSQVTTSPNLSASLAQPSAQMSTANSELFFMIEEIQQQVKVLRGVVEEQANEIRHLKRNAKARYLDLDSRLQGLSKKSSSGIESVPKLSSEPLAAPLASPDLPGPGVTDKAQRTATPVKESSAAARSAYQKAYSLIKEKKFELAVAAFYDFIEKYPEGPLTGNAYYWLGEVYLVLPQLEQARQAFSIVVQAYPEHSKVADSLFKLGVAYDRLQNAKESQKYLTEVQKRFPNSTAAKLAKSYKINR